MAFIVSLPELIAFTLHPSMPRWLGVPKIPASHRYLCPRDTSLPPRCIPNDIVYRYCKTSSEQHYPRSDRRSCSRRVTCAAFAHSAPAHVAHAVPGKHETIHTAITFHAATSRHYAFTAQHAIQRAHRVNMPAPTVLND